MATNDRIRRICSLLENKVLLVKMHFLQSVIPLHKHHEVAANWVYPHSHSSWWNLDSCPGLTSKICQAGRRWQQERCRTHFNWFGQDWKSPGSSRYRTQSVAKSYISAIRLGKFLNWCICSSLSVQKTFSSKLCASCWRPFYWKQVASRPASVASNFKRIQFVCDSNQTCCH